MQEIDASVCDSLATLPSVDGINKGAIERKKRKSLTDIGQRGFTLTFLRDFLAKHNISDKMNSNEIVNGIIKPATSEQQCSYARLVSNLITSRSSRGVELGAALGEVTHFVSYSWSCPLVELVNALENRSRKGSRHNGETYYFIDIFGVNQHNMFGQTELPSLTKVIDGACELVVVSHPWEQPVPFTRVWCLFEVWHAISVAKTKVTLCMNSREERKFKSSLLSADRGKIFSAIRDIDVEKAEATVAADKEMILSKIRSTVGYKSFNTELKECMQMCLGTLAQQSTKSASMRRSGGSPCQTPRMLRDNNDDDYILKTAPGRLSGGSSRRRRNRDRHQRYRPPAPPHQILRPKGQFRREKR